jgi:exosortase C (VPDSG-CTERM-specific)
MTDAAAPPVFLTARFQKFALAAALITLGFAVPLWRLFWFAIGDDLHSYIPLMPLVCAYLAWTLKPELPRESPPARVLAALFFAAGVAAALGYVMLGRSAGALENCLALGALAWLLCLTGAGCWCLGGAAMRVLVFPVCLLYFMIPFPVILRTTIEAALQHGSAVVAAGMFALSGMPVLREGMDFHLPGISFQVAPECSGIHSTLMLFITSLVAGKMILHGPWKRAILCLAILPLALLRNGFRVYVLGELCVHVSPQMMDSPIHHHGGPIFFVLSLVPFFLLLYFLRKREQTGSGRQLSNSEK